MFNKKIKPKKVDKIVFSKEEETDLLKSLIRKLKEDLISAKVQEWIFTQEYITPVHIGKQQAQDSIATYQKRIRYLEENIEVVKLYAENFSLTL